MQPVVAQNVPRRPDSVVGSSVIVALTVLCCADPAPPAATFPDGVAEASTPPPFGSKPPEDDVERAPGSRAPDEEPEPGGSNGAPQMAPLGDAVVRPGESLDVTPEASDPDGDHLEFTLEGERPQGADFEAGTGRLRWTPTVADAGLVVRMAIGATDGDKWVIRPLRVTVVDPDEPDVPPEVVRGGYAVARVGALTVLRPVVVDDHPERLSFAARSPWPAGAEIDGRDGTLRWIPREAAAGREWSLPFEVRDGIHVAEAAFTVRVEAVDRPNGAEPPAEAPPADEPPADEPPADEPPAEVPPVDEPPPAAEPPAGDPVPFGHPPTPALELDWERLEGGGHLLVARPDGDVHTVTWFVDGQRAAESRQGPDFAVAVDLRPGEGLLVEAVGTDRDGFVLTEGRGLLDATEGFEVFVRQVGVETYEIGLRHAPAQVAAIEVRADGVPLVDGVSGARRSERLAVRNTFLQLGLRHFEIDTFGSRGTHRGTLRRSLVLR